MIRRLSLGSAAALALSAGPAFGDEPPRDAPAPYGEEAVAAPRTAPPPYVAEPLPKPAALGHRGFQMALRTGLAIPLGSAKSGDPSDLTAPAARSSLPDLVGWQIPIMLDIGGKPDPHVFIGGYLGFSVGQPAGALGNICSAEFDCLATTTRLGAEVIYSILPDDWVDPWVGYGIGYSWLSAGSSPNFVSLRGWEFAHVLAGVDFRLSRSLGVGPFVDYALGIYGDRHVESPAGTLFDGDIHGRSLHDWLLIGPRFVFFP
jgi:hypothetical protein